MPLDKIFDLICSSIKTNCDEWVYDFDDKFLTEKVKYLVENYSMQLKSNKYENDYLDYSIKWSSGLKEKLNAKINIEYNIGIILKLVIGDHL